MQDVQFFYRGLVIGFSIAAPVGPIGVLCIRTTLSSGRAAGLCVGLGAAAADAVYGGVAAAGLSAVSHFLLGCTFWLKVLGGLFLFYLGGRGLAGLSSATALSEEPTAGAAALAVGGGFSAFLNTFFLTLANPMTILCFAAILGSVGALGSSGSGSAAASLVFGVFLGSAAWSLLLTTGISLIRGHLSRGAHAIISMVSSLIIIGFGGWALLSAR